MSHELPDLPEPARRALESQGIASLEELAAFPRTRLAEVHGIGPAALEMLEKAMKSAGIDYGSNKEG
jgi:DNA-directed RNA polymerase alpha subunit